MHVRIPVDGDQGVPYGQVWESLAATAAADVSLLFFFFPSPWLTIHCPPAWVIELGEPAALADLDSAGSTTTTPTHVLRRAQQHRRPADFSLSMCSRTGVGRCVPLVAAVRVPGQCAVERVELHHQQIELGRDPSVLLSVLRHGLTGRLFPRVRAAQVHALPLAL